MKLKSPKQFSQNESKAKLPIIFANFFQSKIAKILNPLDTTCCFNKIKTDLETFKYTSFKNFAVITQTQLNNIFSFLNTTTFNLDYIQTTVLKKCSPGIIVAITASVNFFLQSAEVPLELKKAIIFPLLKI